MLPRRNYGLPRLPTEESALERGRDVGHQRGGSPEVTLKHVRKRLGQKAVSRQSESDPFLVFYRTLQNDALSAVHKTEIIKNNLNPVWKPIKVPVSRLCGGDEERSIKIECYDWDEGGGHDFIGECHTTLAALREGSGAQNTYTLINPKKQKKKKNYKGSGTLILHNFSARIVPTFLDYIRGGLQLHFTVAVDFTASNGDPRQPTSLHFRRDGVDNQYTLAIKAVGEIIQDYDSDKLFPSLGFGARLPPQWDVSHEFFLNGSAESPYCQGVEGILAAYHHSLQTVGLYGPTNFSPVIRHVSQFAKAHQDGLNYFVLLILTDGIISDMRDTKRALVEASNLPLSVIIVGVGEEDFGAMEELDGDEQRLSSDGLFASRDIVQFVGTIRLTISLPRHLSSRLLSLLYMFDIFLYSVYISYYLFSTI
ncbi:UNVERIFIED_CONTAM: hypothetical protein GTU68_052726 [Idotea baltica]|nr:hypothetical protein [Idotea baltica]